MEPDDRTIRLLQELRDEVRRSSERSDAHFEKMERRFAVIEATAQQLVMLGRGIKTALEQSVDAVVLEKGSGH